MAKLNLALKFAILESRLSQVDVAEKADLHESRLSQIVNGRRDASEAERKVLARILKRKPEELFEATS